MTGGRIVLVTGTDTGIGKTFVTAAIAAALHARGIRVGVAKPVETGCREVAGEPYAEDAATLVAAAGIDAPIGRVCAYRLPDPLAPALAAARAGTRIDVTHVVDVVRALAADAELLLVEGAGGLLVPLTDDHTFADLARAVGATVLVVVGSRLGALNHAVLTFEALAARTLPVAGYVLNRVAPPGDLAADTNAAALASMTTLRCVGELPFVADAAALLATLRESRGAAAARERFVRLAREHLDLAAITGS